MDDESKQISWMIVIMIFFFILITFFMEKVDKKIKHNILISLILISILSLLYIPLGIFILSISIFLLILNNWDKISYPSFLKKGEIEK